MIMTAGRGTLVQIKIGDGESPELFSTISGLYITEMALQNHHATRDHVRVDSWKSAIESSGTRNITFSGTGYFSNSAEQNTLLQSAITGNARNYQMHFSNGDILSGSFLVQEYSRGANANREEEYNLTLTGTGNISLTNT